MEGGEDWWFNVVYYSIEVRYARLKEKFLLIQLLFVLNNAHAIDF